MPAESLEEPKMNGETITIILLSIPVVIYLVWQMFTGDIEGDDDWH